MALTGLQALALSRTYTADTMAGAGAIKGDKGDKGDTGAQGEKGEKGDTGADGVSPTIAENSENTDSIYKLDITDANGTFTTPNLKGTGGSGDIQELSEQEVADICTMG